MLTLMAQGEWASGVTKASFGTKTEDTFPTLPELTSAAACLLQLIDTREPITRNGLLNEYRRHYHSVIPSDQNLVWINDELTAFITDETSAAIVASNELKIDSSPLARLLPLAFRFVRYHTDDSKKTKARYELIHELTTLSVGHRRASVGAGLLINVATEIIIARNKSGKCLTRPGLAKAMRQGVKQTFDFYNSQTEYRGETGHYALLQANRRGRLHIEEVPYCELRHSKYVVDTVLMTFWLVFHAKSRAEFHQRLNDIKIADVGACSGALLALAHGLRFIKKDPG